MKKYKIRITDEALSDMTAIHDYISNGLKSPENAMGQYNRIADAILSLDSFPDRFACFEMEPERSWGVRKLVVDNYLVCYIVDANTVTVLSVIYGASNYHTLLIERFS